VKAVRTLGRAVALAIAMAAWAPGIAQERGTTRSDACASADSSRDAKAGVACLRAGMRLLESGDGTHGWESLMRSCEVFDEGAGCRQLLRLLSGGHVPPSWKHEVEHVLIGACRGDALPESPAGIDVRYRVCYDMGRYLVERAEGGEEGARNVAAYMFKSACEQGQERSCGLLLEACLHVTDDVCVGIPSRDQARQWADRRREREHAIRVKSAESSR
jgi:hypothetical protein